MASKGKIELQVIIHETPAALRFGGDGYYLTFAGTEFDIEKAKELTRWKRTPLKITIEVDE